MRSTVRISRWLVLASLLSTMSIAACGGSDDDDDGGDGTQTVAPFPTPTGSGSPTASPTGTATASPTASPTSSPGGSIEFEGTVVSVDLSLGTLTLAGGQVIDTVGASFDPEGDLYSLSQTASAVESGSPVRAEGDAFVTGGALDATTIKVEVDD